MFDIDDFKFINDTFGHDVGDKVLVEVAGILQSTEGCQESTSRWGGEEFLVLMECDDLKTVEERTKKIIIDVSRRQIKFAGKALTVTVSAGISQLDPHLEYTHSVDRSDRAMYEAKKNGKNCLSIL